MSRTGSEQSMRTLPPISSLDQPTDRPKPTFQTILPATTRSVAPPSLVSSRSYHHTSTPLSQHRDGAPSYYPAHITPYSESYNYDKSAVSSADLIANTQHMTSEQVLAEKRRRNAGASARFRDRRKQREQDMHERCAQLQVRIHELEQALARATGQSIEEIQEGHEIRVRRRSSSTLSDEAQEKSGLILDSFHSLGDRVTELENLVGHSRREKDASNKKLVELEKENAYLRSLLTPASTVITGSSHAPSTPPSSVSASPPAIPQNNLNVRTAVTSVTSEGEDETFRKRQKLDQS
ncbi:hypothetical protein INT43_000001 [Umbelopsis isabellina]|uniref:BZIP domain-containing protein n=1 Tax=Mortierella isabellina TaxID=91625 RepID=A0A8H7PFE1_MORIS|nr:hypothetical protein INT43_000001 [Umbelopsis isabellina]